MKKYFYKILLLFLLIIPINVFAYSKYVIPGGETIGIEVNSKGILIVDFYKVNNHFIAKETGFEIGDRISHQLQEMMEEAQSEKEREAIRKAMEMLR